MIKAEAFELYYPVSDKIFGKSVDYRLLDKLLGIDEYEAYLNRPYSEDVPMAPEIRRKFEMLNGPHWQTVLRANGITPRDIAKLKEKPTESPQLTRV